ncbi:hypothetical protein OA542_00090 [Opitutae bacterium]|nr:hypothetical protein [Opitutae bacterium]
MSGYNYEARRLMSALGFKPEHHEDLIDSLEFAYELEDEHNRPKVKFTKLDNLTNVFFHSLYEPLSKCFELEFWNSYYEYGDEIYDYDLLVCFNKKYALQLRFEEDPEEIILELIYRYSEKEIRPKVSFKDTLRTLERCLVEAEVKIIKLEVMAVSCHRRLPRRCHTERNKDTLSNGDLRAIYKELGFEEWGSKAMIKDILNQRNLL